MALLVGLALLTSCADGGADPVASSTGSPSATSEPTSTVASGATSAAPLVTGNLAPSGFDTVTVRAVQPDGTVCESCMWLAEDPDERARGLMGVTDLGGLDGMVFRYGEEAHRGFWMKDTLLPLSIAFVDASGDVVSTADMVPCTADPCPSYAADAPFLVAIEAPQGGLEELGVVAGATIELAGPCAG